LNGFFGISEGRRKQVNRVYKVNRVYRENGVREE
jgi:hypothetical protein